MIKFQEVEVKIMARSICKIDACSKFVTGLGLCNAHYRMLRRHGDPLIKKGLTPGTIRSWLVGHVAFGDNACLVFPFARSEKGYGSIAIDGFKFAHQWMCNEVHGASPPGRPFALHSCGNGSYGCVNPKHLYWGSGKQNYEDQVEHGVAARGDRHGKSLLTEEAVPVIRIRRERGETYKSIATSYGVHRDTIRAVVNGKAWAWVS